MKRLTCQLVMGPCGVLPSWANPIFAIGCAFEGNGEGAASHPIIDGVSLTRNYVWTGEWRITYRPGTARA